MHVDHSADIAGPQALIRKVLGQNNAVMFLDHSFASNGYAVISRGAVSPWSTCQTLQTRGRRPSGAVKYTLDIIAQGRNRFP